MARSFNYTKRADIAKTSARVMVSGAGAHHVFSVLFALGEYGFAADARVYVECYRKNQLQRFDFGSVGALVPPADVSLDAFGDDVMGLRFRVKVVSATPEKTILGMSKSFRAENDEGGAADCILPLARLPKENENVWEVEFTDDGPQLAINAELEKQVVQKSYFVALVFPAVIREILTYAFVENCDGDLGEWTDDWKRFVLALGGPEFPSVSRDADDDGLDLIRQWIVAAVQAFVCGKGLTKIANSWRDE